MTLFQAGDFKLRSGRQSPFKIECDALTPEDWAGLAAMGNAILRQRGIVFGRTMAVPRGGIPLAEAMNKYATPGSPTILVCEDVWTTGGSVSRFIDKEGLAFDSYAILVAFCRGMMHGNSHAILRLATELYTT